MTQTQVVPDIIEIIARLDAIGRALSGNAYMERVTLNIGRELLAHPAPAQEPIAAPQGGKQGMPVEHIGSNMAPAVAAPAQPEQHTGDRLISITVDGSTHTRTADEWLALARRDLAEQHAGLSDKEIRHIAQCSVDQWDEPIVDMISYAIKEALRRNA